MRAPQLALAVGGAAAVGAAAYTLYKKSNKLVTGVIVFSDGSKEGCGLPKPLPASVSQLKEVVEENLRIKGVRLFLLQAPSKQELKTTEELLQAYADPSLSVNQALVLYATAEGAPLPEAVLQAAAVRAPPPGPRPVPILGANSLYFGPAMAPNYNLHLNTFTPEKVANWGSTITLYYPNNSGGGDRAPFNDVPAEVFNRLILTCDPEVVGELLDRQDEFPKHWGREATERKLEHFAGSGLFTSSDLDPNWKTAHGLLPRGFNQIRIKNYYPVILDKTRSFVLAWSRFKPGEEVGAVNDWLTCMTADAVVKAAMGLDMENVEHKSRGEPLHKFISAFRYGLTYSMGRASVEAEFGKAAAWNPLFNGNKALADRYAQALKDSEAMVADLIEKTRAGEIGGPTSVLSAMLSEVSPSTGQYVRLDTIYGHIMNLMIAGHETTAATLGFTIYYIFTHPEVEAKVLQEIETVLGSRSEPSAEDIPKLVYIEACFREALRLHPAVTVLSRDVMEDTTIKGGTFVVRRGQRIDVNVLSLQRREDQWGGHFGDPNTFNPDRFMPGAAEETGRHPSAYVPWGFGVRACIGSQFALWEAKCFLAMLLRCFRFEVPAGYVLHASSADGGAAPSPHHLKLRIYPRKASSDLIKAFAEAAKPAAAAPAAGAAGPTPTPAPAGAPGAPAGGPAGHGTPLLVVFGSNTGTCEELAGQVVARAKAAGFAPSLHIMDSLVARKRVEVWGAEGKGAAVCITCTYNGQPPDNARGFAKWLEARPAGSLTHTTYSVLGIGNSQWAQTYQAFPTSVDLGLQLAGANRLTPLTTCDVDSTDWLDTFDEWISGLLKSLLVHFEVAAPEGYTPGDAGAVGDAPDRLQLRALAEGEGGRVMDAEAVVELLHGKDTSSGRRFMGKVLESRELQGPGSSRSTKHVVISLPPGVTYRAGDHLEVSANNDPDMVSLALTVLGYTGDELYEWTIVPQQQAGSSTRTLGGGKDDEFKLVVKLRDALTWLVDLTLVPGKKLLASLAESCPCPPEAAKIKAMATDEGYKAEVAGRKLTLVELLAQFRSVRLTLPQLLATLPPLAPRYYSISSSPAAGPDRCSISVGKVEYKTPTGRLHRGLASNATVGSTPVGGKLLVAVRQLQSSFHLPDDPSVPIILIGPGTGVAPMMGFLQERAAAAAAGTPNLGAAHLFFGCRSSKEDFIYKQQLEAYAAEGVLAGLHTAFSRDGPTKVYVQDLIQQQGQQLWKLLEEGAVVFVCGDAKYMAPDVRGAFKGVARKWGGRSEAAAESWFGALIENNRYLEDVWAG